MRKEVDRSGQLQKIATLVTASILVLTPLALAGKGGSGYSRFGIGDIRYFAGSRSAGMGGTTISLLTPGSINGVNPAGQAAIKRTLFSGTFTYEGFNSTDGVQSAFLSSGNFGGALFVLPISPNDGLTFSAGLNPYSTVNYRVTQDYTFGTETVSKAYFGEGGISRAHLGLSLTALDSLHLGLKVNYLFGQIRRGAEVNFTSIEFASVHYRRNISVNGFIPTLGLIYTGLGPLVGLSGSSLLSIGGVLSAATNLDATEERINVGSAGEDTLAERTGQIRIPMSGGLGISWIVNGKYLFAGDVHHQQWRDLRYFNERQPEIRNGNRYSLGFEKLPSLDPRDGYWQKVAYRLGISYLSSYYQVRNQAINEVAVSAGVGLPVGLDSRLDVAIEYGRRGTTAQHLLKDNIIRFSVTLNVAESWFIRIEED